MAMATARRQENKRHGCQGLKTNMVDTVDTLFWSRFFPITWLLKKLDDNMGRKKAGEETRKLHKRRYLGMMNDDEEKKNPWHSMFRLHTHKTSICLLSTCSGPWKVILSQPARETRKKHEKTFKIHPTSPLNHLKQLDVNDSFSHCSSEIRSFR